MKCSQEQESVSEVEERLGQVMTDFEESKHKEETARDAARAAAERGDREVAEVRRHVLELERALAAAQRQLHALEARLDARLADRHSILR